MNKYILNLNKQDSKSGENYEVHNSSCSFLPKSENQKFLGIFTSCHTAINYVKENFSKEIADNVDGCYYCTSCHNE